MEITRETSPYAYRLKYWLLDYAHRHELTEIGAQLVLADFLKVHHHTVSRWSNLRLADGRRIEHATLVAIAAFFKCSVKDLTVNKEGVGA